MHGWRLPSPALLMRLARRPLAFRPSVAALTLLPSGRIDVAARAAVLEAVTGESWPDGLWICAARRNDGGRVVFGRRRLAQGDRGRRGRRVVCDPRLLRTRADRRRRVLRRRRPLTDQRRRAASRRARPDHRGLADVGRSWPQHDPRCADALVGPPPPRAGGPQAASRRDDGRPLRAGAAFARRHGAQRHGASTGRTGSCNRRSWRPAAAPRVAMWPNAWHRSRCGSRVARSLAEGLARPPRPEPP